MRTHLSVHRRRDENRRQGGERNRRERMVRQAVRELGDGVRRRRRNQKKIGAISQFDVSGSPIFFFVKKTRHHWIFGKRLQSQRRDELGRVAGHDRENLVTLLYQ